MTAWRASPKRRTDHVAEAVTVPAFRASGARFRDGYCTVHDRERPQDMRELGRRGGLVSPQTKLRKAVDDDLREQARDVLSRALAGENVDMQQLDAARSLFSYRADQPPLSDPTGGE
jgi:hypothetical protein